MNKGAEWGSPVNKEKLQFIDRPIPYIAPILEQYQLHIDCYKTAISNIPKQDLRSWNLVQIVRNGGDATGVVPYLFEPRKDSVDIYRELTGMAQSQLFSINEQDRAILINGLKNGSLSIPSLLRLDQLYGSFISQLNSKMSPEAKDFRAKNSMILTNALQNRRLARGHETSWMSNFPTKEDSESAMVSFYPIMDEDNKKRVKDIHGVVLVPSLPPENQEILDLMTPNIFRYGINKQSDLSDAEVFLLEGGKVGGMLKFILKQIKEYLREGFVLTPEIEALWAHSRSHA